MSDLLTRLDAAYKSSLPVGDLWNLTEEAAERIREMESINADLYEALCDMVSDRACLSDATVRNAMRALAKARGEPPR